MAGPHEQRPDLPPQVSSGKASGKTTYDPADRAGEFALADLQSVLAATVRKLAATTDAKRVYAWTPAPQEGYQLSAAVLDESPASSPSREDAEAIALLESASKAVDLGKQDPDSALYSFCQRHQVSAAAALRSHDGRPLALFLLGGPADPAGAVRPRTLAELEGALLRIRAPASAAVAVRRMSRLDDEVRHMNRLATLGDLVAEVVHEVRNPLVSMKTFLQLLPENLDNPEFHGDFREVVSEELRRMERLIDTVLKQSRPVVSDQEVGSDPVEILDSTRRLLEQRAIDRGVTLVSQTGSRVQRAAIQEDALRQVVLNLVLNALEATPAEGKVVLECSVEAPRDDPAADGGAANGGAASWVLIAVEDDGPGIPAEHRSRLFEPFSSSRGDRPGGLGLAITHRIIEEVGGSVRFSDAPGGGARFEVRLSAL
jgi:signal transduction histidine kinase